MEKVVRESIELADEAGKRASKLFGVPSGVEGLNELFYKVEITDKGIKRVLLGGYPYRAVINITGVLIREKPDGRAIRCKASVSRIYNMFHNCREPFSFRSKRFDAEIFSNGHRLGINEAKDSDDRRC